jgi:hypothetical protein
MSNYHRKMRKRLSVDIPKDLFLKMKILAIKKNCTMTKWVIRALIKEIRREEELSGT